MTDRPILADWAVAVLRDGDEARARRVARAIRWRVRVSLVLLVSCVLAGIWWDWRWLPTAVLPLLIVANDGLRMSALQWWAKQRTATREAK